MYELRATSPIYNHNNLLYNAFQRRA